MTYQIEFQRRFGGERSLEQELTDLARALPPWARPLYSFALRWILPWIRDLKIKATMADVEQQAQHMADQWQAEDKLKRLTTAAASIQQQHPSARVAIVHIPGQDPLSPISHAISVEHPPSPDDAAQQALGFGSLEIRAPWTVTSDPES
ncbi:MAG: hypothetical protein EB075_04385 [Bacteroidetes bacterium]|jgi:hypothetical protein|nr:hypothetical protein [Bacteroidota bacterium]